MTRHYYLGAEAAVICYDVTDAASWAKASVLKYLVEKRYLGQVLGEGNPGYLRGMHSGDCRNQDGLTCYFLPHTHLIDIFISISLLFRMKARRAQLIVRRWRNMFAASTQARMKRVRKRGRTY